MFKFENKLCPVCRERFHDGDDIAVCPVCGTPHHRACYFKENKCALDSLHANGFVWNGRLPDEPMPVPDISEIPIGGDPGAGEGQISEEDERALTLLGLTGLGAKEREEFRELKESDSMRDLLGTIQDNSKGEDGVSMQELIAYTGTSIWHYTRAFNSFRGMNPKGKKSILSFNVCSGLFSPVYQFYRRMDLLGIAAMLMSVLPSLIILITGGDPNLPISNGMAILLNIVSLLPIVLLCVFGDYLFYLKAVKRIRKIRVRFEGKTDSLDYLKALAASGKPSLARAALGALAMIFARACVLALGG